MFAENVAPFYKYCKQKKAQDCKKGQSISEEGWKQVTEFTVMLTKVAKLLNESADVENIKIFLKFFCHPQAFQLYVDTKLYEHCTTPTEIIKALFPCYIHYMHTDFLRQIVNKFGSEQSKTLLKQYEDNFPRKKPLKQMCDPLSDKEVYAFTRTKRIKIEMGGDTNTDTTTMEDVENVRQTVSKNTGIDRSMIVYANQTPGSGIFTFLIPEAVVSSFSDLDEGSQKDIADHGIVSVEVNDVVVLLKRLPSSKPCPDPREKHQLSSDFAVMFSDVTDLLDKSVNVAKLKDFLDCYSHPLYPEQHYFDPKIYKDANSTKQLIKSLFPQFINFMHYYLLEGIVGKFGCDKAKEVLKQYTDQKYSRNRKLDDLPDPITDGEIEQFHGTKKLKVQVEGDTSNATVEIIDELQKALEKATGIKRPVIVYAFYDPGSVLLTFLVPESILHIFSELNAEDLAILADSGVMKLEVDEVVINNIQKYCTVKSQVAVDSGEHTKPTGLECYLKERATEITSERYSHLLKMLGSAETAMLNDVCSEQLLETFSKDLQDWKKLAPYFGIHEWNIGELVCNYPDENDRKYQALLCWKRTEGPTATYYNLLESVILHGNIEEVEALLQRLGEGKWLC